MRCKSTFTFYLFKPIAQLFEKIGMCFLAVRVIMSFIFFVFTKTLSQLIFESMFKEVWYLMIKEKADFSLPFP